MLRIHCAYHKCLTIYYSRVMRKLYNGPLRFGAPGYRHFNSMIDEFYEALGRYRILSVNNHALDLDRLGDFRITRFVRDPRDLIVSGYFYHRRGAEKWCEVVGPRPERWKVVNGNIPAAMPSDRSYAQYLQELPEEEGLMAEIEFRRHHYDSMARWPDAHPHVRVYRYEDILGNEVETFADILSFYELPALDRAVGRWLAGRYSAKNKGKELAHVRNPEPNQWKRKFTPRVTAFFEERHPGLVEKLGYDR
jgi:hypothetical protein